MKTINELQDEVIEEFSDFDDWMDKYQLLIDLGNEQEPLAPEYKTEQNLIDGCPSGPLGSVKIRRHAADLPEGTGLHVGVISLLEQPEAAAGGVDIIIVEIQKDMDSIRTRVKNYLSEIRMRDSFVKWLDDETKRVTIKLYK